MQDALLILKTRFLRTLLAVLGVVFGVGAVIAMVAIGEGAKQKIMAQIESMGSRLCVIEQKSMPREEADRVVLSSPGLSDADVLALKSWHDASAMSWVKKVDLAFGDTKDQEFLVLATSQSFVGLKKLQIVSGRNWLPLEHEQARAIVLLGKEAYAKLNSPTHVQLNHIYFEVIGVYAAKGDDPEGLNQAILLPYHALRTAIEPEPPYAALDKILVEAKNLEDTLVVKQKILSQLRHTHNQETDFTVFAPVELLSQKNEQEKIFHTVLLLIAAISLLVGGIGIMNIMLANVLERIPEIGVRRAVGARKQDIFFQFLGEAVLICFLGGLLGLLFGVSLAWGLGNSFLMPVSFPAWVIVVALLISVGSGLLFGIMPALHAMRIGPVDALRAGS
jgi:putative ABC transport system permease protein